VHKRDTFDGRTVYQLILARVLCGTPHGYGAMVTRQTKSLVKPPAGCDSVCGGPHTAYGYPEASRMWVVYDRAQVYPAFIVTYCVEDRV